MTHSVRRGRSGFTLVELMIVVLIIGILAGLSVVGYRKYMGRGRVAEAIAVLAEIASREELYRQEFSLYLPARANDANAAAPTVNGDEAAAAFYPADPTALEINTPTSVANSGAFPVEWRVLGIRPKGGSLYCTYMANAGNGNSTVGPPPIDNIVGPRGRQLFPGNASPVPWYYGVAVCNLSGGMGYLVNTGPTAATVFVLSSVSSHMTTWDELN